MYKEKKLRNSRFFVILPLVPCLIIFVSRVTKDNKYSQNALHTTQQINEKVGKTLMIIGKLSKMRITSQRAMLKISQPIMNKAEVPFLLKTYVHNIYH